MSGFTIYETLRIFLPGTLAVAILDVAIRLTCGDLISLPSGRAGQLLNDIQGVGAFAGLAVIIGLFLYIIDLGERLYIFTGDPHRGLPQPSSRFREMLRIHNAAHQDKQYPESQDLGLYFLFSDTDLPSDLHARVYLFGAIYKVMTDMRVLLMTALIVSAPAAIIVAGGNEPNLNRLRLSGSAALYITVISIALLLLGIAGQSRFSGGFRVRLWNNRTMVGQLLRLTLLATVAMSSTIILVTVLSKDYRLLAVVPGAITLFLWFAIEVGPPQVDDVSRGKVLGRVCGKRTTSPQFPVWFRTVTDLSIAVPALIGVSIAEGFRGRSSSGLWSWTIILLPMLLVMSVRKHESRLLGAYANQLAYLSLYERRIYSALRERDGLK